MEKNIRLADIYIKIYNKQPLLMEDLSFLAKYDRECFEKTCHNLIYNMPEAGELMRPAQNPERSEHREITENRTDSLLPESAGSPQASEHAQNTKSPESLLSRPKAAQEEPSPVNTLLDNLKKMEWQEMPIPKLDAGKVKHLLGSLYMELLFPHNDRYRYFDLEDGEHGSVFNKKV